MKTRYLVPGILWLLSGPLLAQDSTQLTLQQAVRLGVQNSKQLKVAYAQTQEAQAQLAQARQRRYPSVDLSATHLQVGSSQIETHVGRPASAEPEPGTGVAATPDVSQVTYGLVSVSQPIFTGFKLRYSVQAANDLKRAAELNAESQQEAVMLNIIDAYYTFYKLAATRRLIAQSLAQAKERVRVFTNQEQNGVLTRNDLLKAQLQQSNIELSLMEVDNNLSVANFNLGILLGLPSGILIALDTARMSHAVPTVAPLDFYQQQAQENRPDLKAAGSQEQAAHANMLATRSGYYPSLALSGGYINAYIPGLLTVNNRPERRARPALQFDGHYQYPPPSAGSQSQTGRKGTGGFSATGWHQVSSI